MHVLFYLSCPSSQSSLLILYKVVIKCKTTCKPIRKPIVITNLPCTPWKLLCNSLYVFCYNLLCCQANVCITPPSLHFSYYKLQQQQTPTFYTLYYGSKSLDDAIFIIKKRCFSLLQVFDMLTNGFTSMAPKREQTIGDRTIQTKMSYSTILCSAQVIWC